MRFAAEHDAIMQKVGRSIDARIAHINRCYAQQKRRDRERREQGVEVTRQAWDRFKETNPGVTDSMLVAMGFVRP